MTPKLLRDGIWALELLARRTAVARWRGELNCSDSEVLQTWDASPLDSDLEAVTELAKDILVELEPA
jgi:hypothetical protein